MADCLKPVATRLINEDPLQLVLSIPLLLEKILAEVDNKTVFNSRLVSKTWNDAALSIFPKRPIKGQSHRALSLGKVFKSSEINPKFDLKLAKSVEFYEGCSCGQNCNENQCISTSTKFFEFWGQYSNQIEKFDFLILSSTAATLFSKLMLNHGQNIKVLSFDFLDRRLNQEFLNKIPKQKFEFANLQTIKQNGCYPFPKVFRGPFQAIISGAPNLRRLELGPDFYPDLSNNKKLVYLSHSNGDFTECIDHKSVSRIFTQIKDSVETLKLFGGGEDVDEYEFDPKDFNFPKMPKLKKFTNYNLTLFPLQNCGKQNLFQIINSKFPALFQLKMGDDENGGVQKFFDELMKRNQKPQEKIVTLLIERINNFNFLGHFKEWFPNLKKLDLMVSKPEGGAEAGIFRENYIDTVFSKLGQLELKHFVFRADFKFYLSDLVKALAANIQLFQGLNYLELEAIDDIMDDLELKSPRTDNPCLKSFIELLEDVTKNVNIVVFRGFSFAADISWELMHYIRENNLPIKFDNR